MTPQQVNIQIPFCSIAGFVLNVNTVIALDFTDYKQGAADRKAVLHLLGPVNKEFTETAADELWLWYLSITGQTRVQPAM